MESGEVPLAELLAKFEDGNKPPQLCETRLKDAELKIEQLKRQKDGVAFEKFSHRARRPEAPAVSTPDEQSRPPPPRPILPPACSDGIRSPADVKAPRSRPQLAAASPRRSVNEVIAGHRQERRPRGPRTSGVGRADHRAAPGLQHGRRTSSCSTGVAHQGYVAQACSPAAGGPFFPETTAAERRRPSGFPLPHREPARLLRRRTCGPPPSAPRSAMATARDLLGTQEHVRRRVRGRRVHLRDHPRGAEQCRQARPSG